MIQIENFIKSNKLGKKSKKYMPIVSILILLVLSSIIFTLPAFAYPHLPVVKSDTVDYYRSYGDPDIVASLRGNPEFSRGENATLQIVLSNIGTIEKIVTSDSTSNMRAKLDIKTVEVSKDEYDKVVSARSLGPYLHDMKSVSALSEKAREEMLLESSCSDAKSLKIRLVSNDPAIKIPAESEVVFLDELKSGYFNVVMFPIEIGSDAKSGNYSLDVVIDYDFSDNVLMYNTIEKQLVSTSFIKEDVFVREMVSDTKTVSIPLSVRKSPEFEISDFTREIHSGINSVNVTYKNVGDAFAYDSVAKISPMDPLDSETRTIPLGDLAPGESKTATYNISVGDAAIEKTYVTNTDIRYYDENGDMSISSSMKIPLEYVHINRILTFKNFVYGFFIIVLLYGAFSFVKNLREGNSGED